MTHRAGHLVRRHASPHCLASPFCMTTYVSVVTIYSRFLQSPRHISSSHYEKQTNDNKLCHSNCCIPTDSRHCSTCLTRWTCLCDTLLIVGRSHKTLKWRNSLLHLPVICSFVIICCRPRVHHDKPLVTNHCLRCDINEINMYNMCVTCVWCHNVNLT
ncbi:hypothetical protein NP493_20g07038 [Ridgeia piscesae]|uniref:Uncharacterized protein n=1 Tax=Ridgeia piscesae TaxID=27915 RepID=A0AAD9UKT2_RIDPI|nr:hypothetical protein NP493_20g07038 [Ridgeia piscesae]